MRSQKRQACEYHLTILHVRMKVKFPCRMKIEHMGTLLTGQTPISGDNNYIFNQEIILQDDQNQQCFEFVVNLITQMGSKYIAGVIKLYHSQLLRSQGQKLVLSLSKCIDTQAFCQIRVDQVRTHFFENSRSKERRSSSKNSKVSFNQRQYYAVQTPKAGSFHQLKHVGSLTEYQYPSAHTPLLPRSYYNGKLTNQRPQSFKSPVKIQDTMYQRTNEGYNQSNKFQYDIEQSGYKQAYLKLKQKSKKEIEQLKNELNKKSLSQNNQNALKLELMKYKIKLQELERTCKDKNNKFQQSSASIHKIRQLQLQNNYIIGQIKKRDGQILRLEDTIQSLTCDLQELTQSLRDKKNDEIIKTKELKLINQTLKQKLAQKQKELQYLRKDHQQILKQKQEDFNFKNAQLQKDRKIILEQEKSLQNKIIEGQKVLQKEKAQNKQRLQEELSKIEKLQKQNGILIIQRQQVKRKLSQAENLITKEQYERKLLRSECENLRTQCLKNKEYRDKFYDVFNQNKVLNEKIIILQGQIDKLVENKNENTFHLNKQSQDQIEYFKQLSKQSEDRVKSSNSRITQLQNLINQNKIQYEKMRRVLQSVNQQLNDSKQKEKAAKRHMRQRQNNSIKIQQEYTILKQKVTNIDQFYNAQIEKIKGESKASIKQLQIQKINNAQLQTKLQYVQNELKNKTEKLEQALQKAIQDQKIYANNSIMVQQLRKNLQINERQFQRLTEHCQKLQKQEKFRLQEIEQNLKVKSQKVEKLKKDLKDVQQKYISQAHSLKNQSNEIQSLTQLRAQYEQILSENTQKIKILQVELMQSQNQKSKLTKMNEFLQEQINKYKQEIKQNNLYLQQSQIRQMELREHLTTASNEINQFSSKLISFKKQYERFKQALVDLDTKYFSPLFKDDKETKLIVNQQATFNELLLSVTGQFKEIKHCFAKKQQQITLQKKQNESLRIQIKNMVAQTQNLQTKMKEQIQQLQGQIQQILYDKSVEAENFNAIINQLKKNIEEKQSFQETLQNQIQQLNFNINSVKMDFQAANDFNTKKINQMRKFNNEFQLKLKEKQIQCENLEQKIEFQAQQIVQNNFTLQQFHEINIKQQKEIEQIKQILEFQRYQYSALQQNKKQLAERLNELEFILTSTKDENEKIKKSLQQEQTKSIMLNNLIGNLMKEKEMGIRKQLEGSQILTNLQNKLLQKEKSIQNLQQQNKTITANYQGLKQTVKSVNSVNKQLQTQLKQLNSINLKAQQKLTQKDTFQKNTEQGVKKNIQKYQKIIQKVKSQNRLLQQQFQTNRIRMNEQIKSACERISQLLIKLQQQKAQNQTLQKKYIDIEEQMFQQHQKITQQEEALNQNEKIINQLTQKIQDFVRCMDQLNEELKTRDQKLYGLSDQNYNLGIRIQEEQKYRYEQLQRMGMEHTSKYENMCEDYQNRIEILQNQAKNLKDQLQNINSKLIRKDFEIKRLEQQQLDFKKLYEQKFKKIEHDKSTTLSLKNTEIQKLNDEIRHIDETIKLKQTQKKRLLSQFEALRKTSASNEYKLREYEQKYNQLLKQQRQESEQYRKKESEFRIYKQSIQTYKWNMQRQMKKLLQSYVKNFMQITDQKNSSRIIGTVRSLQISIFQVINQRQNQVK